jgi:hypothetical protein
MDGVDGIEGPAHLVTDGVATTVADRPQPEREVVLSRGGEAVVHGRARLG